MEKVQGQRAPLQRSTARIWTDAKATDDKAWIGGWIEESADTKLCCWFSMEVTEASAPWLFFSEGVIRSG